ncbi:MAG: TetR/AcrR family transcriptional regulator [Chitinophagaceae bacterium]
MSKIKSRKNSTKKEAIIETASHLFREKGFSATSMRDLAEKVGVEAASLYNHIQSKAELLQEICFRVANQFITHIDAIERNEDPALHKLEAIIRFHIRMMLDQYENVYISDHEWRHLPEPYLSNFLNQRRSYRKRLAALIEKGIQQGEMKNIEPYVAVLTILSAISGLESWQRSRKSIPPETMEDNMVKYLIEGIKK